MAANSKIRLLRQKWKKQQGRCWICGAPVPRPTFPRETITSESPTLDHVIPREKDGPMTAWNVAMAHNSCNSNRTSTWPPLATLIRMAENWP